jgi:hypothetical protein
MSHLIDELINFDTDYYELLYKDLQKAVEKLNDVDKKLFLLNHFIKHGYSEKRKYRLKTKGRPSDHRINRKQFLETLKTHDDDSSQHQQTEPHINYQQQQNAMFDLEER